MKKILLTILALALTMHSAWSQQQVKYDVYALKYASVSTPFPISGLVMDGPDSAYVDAIFMFWLIKGNNGRTILVDAGFLRDIEEAKDFALTGFVRPDSALMKLGIRAIEVTDIILTHPHWDHMDGVDLFPNAQIWIQKEDYNYFVRDAWEKDGNHGGFNRRDVGKLANAYLAGKMKFIDGDNKKVVPGVRVYTGSRHTFNSQYVVVESGVNKIVIASDNMYTYYNLEHLKSAPQGATFDPEGYVNAMKRMKTLASDVKFILPGHDGALFSKFPEITDGVVQIK